MILTPYEYDKVKERYNVISTIPVDAWLGSTGCFG